MVGDERSSIESADEGDGYGASDEGNDFILPSGKWNEPLAEQADGCDRCEGELESYIV